MSFSTALSNNLSTTINKLDHISDFGDVGKQHKVIKSLLVGLRDQLNTGKEWNQIGDAFKNEDVQKNWKSFSNTIGKVKLDKSEEDMLNTINGLYQQATSSMNK